MMKTDDIIQNAVVFIAVAALVALIVLAVAAYAGYGRGIGYFVVILLPMPYIISGLVGVITRFWWIATAAVDICAVIVISDEFNGFLVLVLVFLNTMLAMIGLCGRVFRKKLNPGPNDRQDHE